MRRCKHATVFRFCRASLTALRAPMFESQTDSSVQPKVGCVADYLGSTFKSSTTPTRVASVFGARLCAEHQPQQLWRIECIHPLPTLRLVPQLRDTAARHPPTTPSAVGRLFHGLPSTLV